MSILFILCAYALLMARWPDLHILDIDEPFTIFFGIITCVFMIPAIAPTDSLKSRLPTFLTFVALIFLGSVIMQRSWLQQNILALPELVLLFVIGILLLGRYTGLQLTEYVRFWPLIKKQLFPER